MLAVDRHQRLAPQLEEHAHRLALRVHGAQRGPVALHFPRDKVRGGAGAHQRAERAQRARNAFDITDLALEHRQAESAQLRLLPIVEPAAPHQHQVGLQLGDGLEIQREGVAHHRQPRCGLGIVAVAHHAHHGGATAGGEGELRQMRRQADHALRRAGQGDRLTGIVGGLDVLRDRGRAGSKQRGGKQCLHARVFGSNSHQRATAHCGHSGLRAWHT